MDQPNVAIDTINKITNDNFISQEFTLLIMILYSVKKAKQYLLLKMERLKFLEKKKKWDFYIQTNRHSKKVLCNK